jgi:hypothetical protein
MGKKRTSMIILAMLSLSLITIIPYNKDAYAISMVEHTDPDNYNVSCMGFQNSPHYIIAGVEDTSNSNRLTVRVYTVNETSGALTLFRTILSTSIGAITADSCHFLTVDANHFGEQSGNVIYVMGTPTGVASTIITKISITTGAILAQIALDGTSCDSSGGLITGGSIYVMGHVTGAGNSCVSDTGASASFLVRFVYDTNLNQITATSTGINGNTVAGISNCIAHSSTLFSCNTSTGASDHIVYFDSSTSSWVTRGPATTDSMQCGWFETNNIYCARQDSNVVSRVNVVTDTTTAFLTLTSVDRFQLLDTTIFAVVQGTTTLREYNTTPTIQASYTTPNNTNEITTNDNRNYVISYFGAFADSDTFTLIFFGIDLSDPSEEEGEEEGNQVGGFCGLGTLRDCLGSNSALSGLVPANQNITSIGTTIGQGVGLINPNDENPRTNGVGLFYMLITGSFFAIALMTTIHTLNMRGFISASVKEIDPIFWLFLVVGTVSVAWYLDWIDDIIFAAMTVGLAGLISFGVLKHFGRI